MLIPAIEANWVSPEVPGFSGGNVVLGWEKPGLNLKPILECSQMSTWWPSMDAWCSCEHEHILVHSTHCTHISEHKKSYNNRRNCSVWIYFCMFTFNAFETLIQHILKHADHLTSCPEYFLWVLFAFDTGTQQYPPFNCSPPLSAN